MIRVTRRQVNKSLAHWQAVYQPHAPIERTNSDAVNNMINKFELIGHAGNDPKMGNGVAFLSVATKAVWNDSNGQRQEKTTWHNVRAFGGVADVVGEYVHKGCLVYIEGRLDNDTYQDEHGQEFTTYQPTATLVRVLKDADQRANARATTPQNTKPATTRATTPRATRYPNSKPF